jgi:hypothetical protein
MGIEGKTLTQMSNPFEAILSVALIVGIEQMVGQNIRNFPEFRFAQAAGGHGRRP